MAKNRRMTIKELALKLDMQEVTAKKDREHYRGKMTGISNDVVDIKTCVGKIDRTLHGEEESGNPGMVSRLMDLEKTHYITRFIHSFWSMSKRPLFAAITVFILALMGFILREYLIK